MLFIRISVLLLAFLLVQGIYNGNKFNIRRVPFIVYLETDHIGERLVFCGIILSKVHFLTTADPINDE